MPKAPKQKPFVPEGNDPLAAEHRDVSQWIEDAIAAKAGASYYYFEPELKSHPSGRKLLDAPPEQARRYVLAALEQVHHWEETAKAARAGSEAAPDGYTYCPSPGWDIAWSHRQQAIKVVAALVRRTLPFVRDDLVRILQHIHLSTDLFGVSFAIGGVVRSIERFAEASALDAELCQLLRQLALRLRTSRDSSIKRQGTALEQLCAAAVANTEENDGLTAKQPPATPALAGSPAVLNQLKRYIGISGAEADPTATLLEPDQFTLRTDSPLQAEHALLSKLIDEYLAVDPRQRPPFESYATAKEILALDLDARGRVLLAAVERRVNTMLSSASPEYGTPFWFARNAANEILHSLAVYDFQLSRDGFFDWLMYLSTVPHYDAVSLEFAAPKLIERAEHEAKHAPLSAGERYVLSLFRAVLIPGPMLCRPTENTLRLNRLLEDGAAFALAPCEVWAEAVNHDVANMSPEVRAAWMELFSHALTANAARPSAKWLKTAQKLIDALGGDVVVPAFRKWFALVNQGRSVRRVAWSVYDSRGAADTMHEENATCLRGLVWMNQLLPDREALFRSITEVALSAYRKVPGVGPRAVKVGNGAVYALSTVGTIDAVGQLAMLKVRVKFGTAQKEIEKAFNAAAEALGLPRDQIEEMGVPSYGLEQVGRRSETLGEYRAELVVSPMAAELQWFDSKGKALKSVPAKVKSEFGEDLAELKQSAKDIDAMLPAQRSRIDGMFLLEKSWPYEIWRERYLDHPLVGVIARALIWCIDGVPALFVDGAMTDLRGAAIEHGKTADVALWHPIGREVSEVVAWRNRIEELRIVQPFKQAYREVYLLTDAERRTRTYSNRFAAHVIRQHQFNALCGARGWKNVLRLLVDSSYPPASKEIPHLGLRAEFWIEGIGDDFGRDTTDAGAFLRLATDQVRFYRIDAEMCYAHAGGGGYTELYRRTDTVGAPDPLPLEEVPPLALSEIMRDVDLFVGVASVGNDPTWQDGGPDGRHREYWQSYSFGELSGTASTRKQVLERLVPRLKIADRCSFNDRFLLVRGKKRTYKIHLGSGNILMEPNDQYLCIVPDAKSRAGTGDIYLPFEGDNTLSIILSKALLLADDEKIKDPTITRQIEMAG